MSCEVFGGGRSVRAGFIFDLKQAGKARGCERRPLQTAVKELPTRLLQATRVISHHKVNKRTSPQKKEKKKKSDCTQLLIKSMSCFPLE